MQCDAQTRSLSFDHHFVTVDVLRANGIAPQPPRANQKRKASEDDNNDEVDDVKGEEASDDDEIKDMKVRGRGVFIVLGRKPEEALHRRNWRQLLRLKKGTTRVKRSNEKRLRGRRSLRRSLI